ncbi:MAG: serine hydrolase domain-containing protein [Pseudomonadota bacterium]
MAALRYAWQRARMALALGALGLGTSAVGEDAAGLAEALRTATGAPAVGVGLSRAGRVDIGVAGLTRPDGSAQVAVEDPWHVGSLTKAMTATLAARLVEAGQISWDDPVAEHLPDLVPDGSPYAGVRLTDLLAHRSGLPANLERPGDLGDGAPARRRYASDILRQPPDGTTYSNAGYVVAAAMMEAATGTAWETLIAREVFAPLGIGSAGFGAPPRPFGHRTGVWGQPVPVQPGPAADNIPALGPAGRVHLTIADLLAFGEAHLTRRDDILSAASWDRLQTPVEGTSYALGWVVPRAGILGHDGSNTLWLARILIDRPRETVIVLVSNWGNIRVQTEAFDQMVRRILEGP